MSPAYSNVSILDVGGVWWNLRGEGNRRVNMKAFSDTASRTVRAMIVLPCLQVTDRSEILLKKAVILVDSKTLHERVVVADLRQL